MFSKGRSNLRTYIEDTGEYLSYLLDRYPSLLSSWLNEKDHECKSIARESSHRDRDVETSIYNSLFQGFESFGETEILFYDAMFIMTYSFYDSVITKLSNKYGCENRPSVICEKNNVQITDEAKEVINFLYNKIRILRNQFCHNFLGTIGAKREVDKQVVIEFVQIYQGMISYDDDSIHILKREFVSEVLEKERFVLNELIQKLKI